MTGEAGDTRARRLAALHALSFPEGECWGEAAMAEVLAMPGCLAIEAPDGLILIRVAADEAEVITFAVSPPARRRGLGGRLLDRALALALAAGATRMLLEVSEHNVAAQALYAGRGFAQAGRRRRYYADGTDALLLARTLG